MIFSVDNIRIVCGLTWFASVTDTSIRKEVLEKKLGRWHWNTSPNIMYGILNEEDQKARKKLPIHAAPILLSIATAEVDTLGIFKIPDTNMLMVVGVIQGKPHSELDYVIDDNKQAIADALLKFHTFCNPAHFSTIGDIEHEQIDLYTLEDLAQNASTFTQIKKARGGIINPVSVSLMLVALGFAGKYAYSEYKAFKIREAEKILLLNQKSAQQLYDENIKVLRTGAALPASTLGELYKSLLTLPTTVGGWSLEEGSCTPTVAKDVMCKLQYGLVLGTSATNKTFEKNAQNYGFESQHYESDLKKIHVVKLIKNLGFIDVGHAMDNAQKQATIVFEFGSILQNFFQVGIPALEKFEMYGLPMGIEAGKVDINSPHSAKFSTQGPFRILELFSSFPKNVIIDEVSFSLSNTPLYKVNQSMAMAKVSGHVFANESTK